MKTTFFERCSDCGELFTPDQGEMDEDGYFKCEDCIEEAAKKIEEIDKEDAEDG